MFKKLMEFVERRKEEVAFFYDQLDKWFLSEPNLSLGDRAKILCDVVECLEGIDVIRMDAMHQFIVADSWKNDLPLKSIEYEEYIKSFDSLLTKLKGKTDEECNKVVLEYRQKIVALMRLLDYKSIRRIIEEAIADGLSEQHFRLLAN